MNRGLLGALAATLLSAGVVVGILLTEGCGSARSAKAAAEPEQPSQPVEVLEPPTGKGIGYYGQILGGDQIFIKRPRPEDHVEDLLRVWAAGFKSTEGRRVTVTYFGRPPERHTGTVLKVDGTSITLRDDKGVIWELTAFGSKDVTRDYEDPHVFDPDAAQAVQAPPPNCANCHVPPVLRQ